MKEKLMVAYWQKKWAFKNAVKDFMNKEKGASDMVTVIILIVIVIAVAAIFKDTLLAAVNAMKEKLMDIINS